MSTLSEIEAAIEQLPPQQIRELREWMAERAAREWDRQLESDVVAGKFDALRARVREDDASGKCGDL